jgi:hypothetical protein
MRSIKMLGLVALTALMALAFVGASSAMGEPTSLCKADETPCSEENAITHVHETSVGKGVLKSSLPTIECTVLFLGDGSLGAPLVISGTFTYSSCNNFCSVKEENGPAELEVLKTAADLGEVSYEFLVNVKCPFINCNFIGEGLEGHALGPLTSKSGENGSIVITEQVTEKESGSCPEEAFLTLATTPLEQVNLEGPQMVCIEVASGKGYYLGAGSNGMCANVQTERKGNYELGWSLYTNAGMHVCAHTTFGLYLRTNDRGTACNANSSDSPFYPGNFELGIVR